MAREPVTPIGHPGWSTRDFTDFLFEKDPCFGAYESSNPECAECVAPVIVSGKLVLLNEACAARRAGAGSPNRIHRLTSQQVLEKVRSGADVREIFRAILGDADPDHMGLVARDLLATRLAYLSKKGEPVPTCPPTRELLP